MDGVLADFQKELDDYKEHWKYFPKYKNRVDTIPNIFKNLEPIKGSIEAIQKLYESGKYELFIATTSPWDNETAASQKVEWVKKYFGEIFYKRMFITHRKDMLMGDYLIDDRTKNGAGDFKGELLKFGYDYENDKMNEYPDWNSILKKLL